MHDKGVLVHRATPPPHARAVTGTPQPLPVTVTNQPPQDYFLGVIVPIVTLIAAAVGTGVTLWGIPAQIRLMRKQIEQQDQAIKLALQDLSLTQNAFDITEEQAMKSDERDAMKSEIVLKADGSFGGVQIRGYRRVDSPGHLVSFEMALSVINLGTRAAATLIVEIELPADWNSEGGWAAQHQRPNVLPFSGNPQIATRQMPGLIQDYETPVGIIYAQAHPGKYVLNWKAKTEQGNSAYPATDEHGGAVAFPVEIIDFTVASE